MSEPTTGHSKADCRGVTTDNEDPLSLKAGAALTTTPSERLHIHVVTWKIGEMLGSKYEGSLAAPQESHIWIDLQA